MPTKTFVIDDCAFSISGRLLKIATVRDEPYECIKDPERIIAAARNQANGIDILSFMQEMGDRTPHYFYHMEPASLAMLPITTYDNWWKKEINPFARNRVRKAQKSGVDLRVVPFDDELVKAIKAIYDESSVRQGKGFTHFQKPVETIKRELATFPDRSTFIGAFVQGELIGFVKLVQGAGVASLMHIIAKVSERNKAPTNALIAKAVEICAERGLGHLHYGIWSIGGLGQFKENHAFQRFEIPRYFVPITAKGRIALNMRLHHRLRERLPERWREHLIAIRNWLRPARSIADKGPTVSSV